MMRGTVKTVMLTMMCVAALMTAACSSDDNAASSIPQQAVYDYATMVSTGGDGTVFEMRKYDDSELLTYTSRLNLSKVEKISAGDRLIICYNRTDGDTYSSGAIDLYGYVLLAGTRRNVVTDDSASVYMQMPRLPMRVAAMWRSGTYLNITGDIYVTRAQRPVKYALVMDPLTSGAEIPDLYPVYVNAEGNDGLNRYTVYASFDMAQIWDDPRYRGARIVYNTTDGPQSLTLNK